jgi:hypothetical protein
MSNHFINLGFRSLDKRLQATVGKHAVGDQLSFADICVVPQVNLYILAFNNDISGLQRRRVSYSNLLIIGFFVLEPMPASTSTSTQRSNAFLNRPLNWTLFGRRIRITKKASHASSDFN